MVASSVLEAIPKKVRSSLGAIDFRLKEDGLNPRICGLLDDTVLAGGKRFRPLLTLMMADFFGLPMESGAALAVDIERVHAATLAHDDVVDQAEVRRGRPSINAVASGKHAILAGDYLLARVMREVSLRGDVRVLQALSEVISDLVEGEWLQIENTKTDALSRKDVELVAHKKTGSVLSWCCYAPAIVAGATDETIEAAKVFGRNLGLIFQLGDDILDFTRTDGAVGADIKNGVINSVIFEIWVARLGEEGLDISNKALGSVEASEVALAVVKVRGRMAELVDECLHSWARIKATAGGKSLSGKSVHTAVETMISYLAERV